MEAPLQFWGDRIELLYSPACRKRRLMEEGGGLHDGAIPSVVKIYDPRTVYGGKRGGYVQQVPCENITVATGFSTNCFQNSGRTLSVSRFLLHRCILPRVVESDEEEVTCLP